MLLPGRLDCMPDIAPAIAHELCDEDMVSRDLTPSPSLLAQTGIDFAGLERAVELTAERRAGVPSSDIGPASSHLE